MALAFFHPHHDSRSVRTLILIPFLAVLLGANVAAEESLTLEQALATAQRANENAAIARERLIQSQGAVREAYAELLPRLTVSGTYTPVSDRNGEYVQGVAAIDLTLIDPTSIPRLDRASRLRDAQQFDADELRRTLAFDTANGFFLVLAASRLVSAAERRLGVADEALRQARLRAEAGLVERSAVTRSELESATARTELIRARNGALRSRFALAYLLGAQPADMQLGTRWPTLIEPASAGNPERPFADLLHEAAGQRGDIRALDARAEAARFAAREPLAGSLPRLSLHGEADYLDDRSRSPDTTDWRASLVATWDLYDGGARYGRRERLAASAREVQLLADAARRRLGLELANALADVATTAAASDQAEARVKVAKQNAEEIGIRFAQGLSTALEQADAIVAAYEAEIELARSRFGRQQAHLTLEQALGRWPGNKMPSTGPKP